MVNQEPGRELRTRRRFRLSLLKKAVMSKLFNRKAFIPFWFLICVIFAAISTPMTWATGLLVVVIGAVVPVIAVLLWKVPPPTIAEVLNRVERPTTRY